MKSDYNILNLSFFLIFLTGSISCGINRNCDQFHTPEKYHQENTLLELLKAEKVQILRDSDHLSDLAISVKSSLIYLSHSNEMPHLSGEHVKTIIFESDNSPPHFF